MRRALCVVLATVVGLVVGVVVNLIGVFCFPGVLFGEAALTHSDGKPNFYDRTTWWDTVPIIGAALGFLLAWRLSKRVRGAPDATPQQSAPGHGS